MRIGTIPIPTTNDIGRRTTACEVMSCETVSIHHKISGILHTTYSFMELMARDLSKYSLGQMIGIWEQLRYIAGNTELNNRGL